MFIILFPKSKTHAGAFFLFSICFYKKLVLKSAFIETNADLVWSPMHLLTYKISLGYTLFVPICVRSNFHTISRLQQKYVKSMFAKLWSFSKNNVYIMLLLQSPVMIVAGASFLISRGNLWYDRYCYRNKNGFSAFLNSWIVWYIHELKLRLCNHIVCNMICKSL